MVMYILQGRQTLNSLIKMIWCFPLHGYMETYRNMVDKRACCLVNVKIVEAVVHCH